MLTSSIRAATRIEAPRSRKRIFLTPKAEIPPIFSAISESERRSVRMKSLSSILDLLPAGEATSVRADGAMTLQVTSIATVADALAVMMVDLVSVLPGEAQRGTLERLANRLDDRGRTPNGSEAARLLGAVSASMLKMGL